MPTTHPVIDTWTPAEVSSLAWSLVGFVSGVFSALGYLVVKIINAKTQSKLQLIKAEAEAKIAVLRGQTDQLSQQVGGLQSQVTQVALQTPPPPEPPADKPKGS